jgi:hypothetical protein
VSRGRMAAESAEKSSGINFRKQIEHSRETLPERMRKFKEDKNKGIEMPEKPSKKAMELINKGKPVAFT